MELKYKSEVLGALIMMAVLMKSNSQYDLFDYTVDGRSFYIGVSLW